MIKLFAVFFGVCSVTFTLGFFWNPLWFLVPIFMGLSLIQSAFTDFCPLSRLVLGKPGGAAGNGAGKTKTRQKKAKKTAAKSSI